MDDRRTARRACALISLRKAPPAKAGLKIKLRERPATERHRGSETSSNPSSETPRSKVTITHRTPSAA